jgi:thymidylate synthase (FAD)
MKILDKGFITVVDKMGSDDRVVQSAKVSFGKDQEEVSQEKKEKLIKYLITNGHTSPLEHCMITFHVKCPLFVRSQWFRHRTWKFNEVSARYREVPEEIYVPEVWRGQSKSNKQCSDVEFTNLVSEDINSSIKHLTQFTFSKYKRLINDGVSREMARMILPQSMYTEFYATVDLNNLIKFVNLRDHDHAQYEIRVYAKAIKDIIKEWCPIIYNVIC